MVENEGRSTHPESSRGVVQVAERSRRPGCGGEEIIAPRRDPERCLAYLAIGSFATQDAVSHPGGTGRVVTRACAPMR
jgi:hypothetical protein